MTTVTADNLAQRKKYMRPQAMLFANEAVRERVNNVMVWTPIGNEGEDWIILSDHNRSELGLSVERIENRKRMIDATMRSYYTADKYSVSASWSELPSRATMQLQTLNISTGTLNIPPGCLATVDGGAGGAELKYWYDTHPGPFFVLLQYDDYKTVEVPPPAIGETYNPVSTQYLATDNYRHAKIMYFGSFSADVAKRQTYFEYNADGSVKYKMEYDVWNVSLSLEEA